MNVIYEYVVGLARRLTGQNSAVLLDYGCGAGEIVQLASKSDMDAYGVDMFYEGGDARTLVTDGLLGTRILELDDGKIPFPESKFDIVVSNQVFEHIDDFDQPVQEIHRVLKPHGLFINLFPTREVWREGHIGIPFAHWFRKGSKIRYVYVLLLRSLGVGYFKSEHGPPGKWTTTSLDWIDKWTYYKPLSTVRSAFEPYFHIDDFSDDYLRYRLEQHPRLKTVARITSLRWLRPFLRFTSHRLSGRVFVLRKS